MAAVIGYDCMELYREILMDLTLEEGVDIVTRDRAKPERVVTLNGVPTWGQAPSNLTKLDFNGTTDYLDCPAADTADLDFTSGDYSIAIWVNCRPKANAQIVIGRYGVDLDGWEVYFEHTNGSRYLQLRHHHASLAPNLRDGCYSENWTENVWWLLGITRQKSAGTSYPIHYRNGVAIETTWEAGGLLDPDTCNRDLVLGCRYTKDANWYEGQMYRPRVWPQVLTAEHHLRLFDMERHWFGV